MALKFGRVEPLEIWLGETRTDGVQVTDDDNANLSALTGTYTVYDTDGTTKLIDASALTITGTTTLTATHSISAGVAPANLTEVGRYRVLFYLTDATDEWIWAGYIIVGDPAARN